MSNPSVTATINADDRASPVLAKLVDQSQRLAQAIKAAFSEGAGGSAYTNSLRQANTHLKEHLTTLEKVHKVQTAIAATVAGAAVYKVASVGKNLLDGYIPYERQVRYQKAIQHYSNSDMAMLERERIMAANQYGLKPEDTLHAQQQFVTRGYSAPIVNSATERAIVLGKALGIPADEAAKIGEGIVFGQGTRLTDAAQTSTAMRKAGDLAAVAAKTGAMSGEDIEQFSKYALGMTTAAGISPQQAFAVGMTLKKNNIGGDESGVFMRQMSARLMRPDAKAYAAFAHMGINYDDYATHGAVSSDAIDGELKRRFGKGLGEAGKAHLDKAFEDGDAMTNREAFQSALREAVEASGEKLSRTDMKHLTDAGTKQYDLAKGGFRGGDLLDEILKRANSQDITALTGDKQGGRATQLLNALDVFRTNLEKLNGADGFAENVAKERMEGLAAAADRLTAAFDMAEKQVVKSQEGWITPLIDAAGKVVGTFNELSDGMKQALTGGVLVGLGIAMKSVAETAVGVVRNLGSLAISAERAALALSGVGKGGLPGLPGGAVPGAVAGSPSMLARLGTAGSFLLGWPAAAAYGTALGIEAIRSIPAGGSTSGRGVSAVDGSVVPALKANQLGKFPKWNQHWYQSPLLTNRDLIARTNSQLGELGITDPTASPFGAQSAVVKLGRAADGDAKWGSGKVSTAVEVTGTVSGSAELHQNIAVEIKPSTYFEGVVRRAEAVANMGINGNLGTGLHGPGDNSVKSSGPSPAQAAPTGGQ